MLYSTSDSSRNHFDAVPEAFFEVDDTPVAVTEQFDDVKAQESVLPDTIARFEVQKFTFPLIAVVAVHYVVDR